MSQSGTYFNYQVTRSAYDYAKARRNGGFLAYQAVQYLITDTITGRKIILRSRGSGNGTSNPFFDIYIEDDTSMGVPRQTSAFRGDLIWFTYVGMTAEQALNQTSETDGRVGEFPSITCSSRTLFAFAEILTRMKKFSLRFDVQALTAISRINNLERVMARPWEQLSHALPR